jgi:hypothetical protein
MTVAWGLEEFLARDMERLAVQWRTGKGMTKVHLVDAPKTVAVEAERLALGIYLVARPDDFQALCGAIPGDPAYLLQGSRHECDFCKVCAWEADRPIRDLNRIAEEAYATADALHGFGGELARLSEATSRYISERLARQLRRSHGVR